MRDYGSDSGTACAADRRGAASPAAAAGRRRLLAGAHGGRASTSQTMLHGDRQRRRLAPARAAPATPHRAALRSACGLRRRRLCRPSRSSCEVGQPPSRVTTASSVNTASCSAVSLARWKRSRPARAADRSRHRDRRTACSHSSGVASTFDDRRPANRAARSVANRIMLSMMTTQTSRGGRRAEPGVDQVHVVEHHADARDERRVVLRLQAADDRRR